MWKEKKNTYQAIKTHCTQIELQFVGHVKSRLIKQSLNEVYISTKDCRFGQRLASMNLPNRHSEHFTAS